MRRILATLLALLTLAMPAALAENVPAVDLDSMTAEELIALHQEIGRRLTMVNGGDVVYSEDGITIRWMKLLDLDRNNLKYGFTVENTTGVDCGIEVADGAINGMQFTPVWNTGMQALNNGMSLYTGSYSKWMAENFLADFGITHVTDIYLKVTLHEPKDGNRFNYTPYRTIEVRFPVDIDISAALK